MDPHRNIDCLYVVQEMVASGGKGLELRKRIDQDQIYRKGYSGRKVSTSGAIRRS